MSTLASNEYKTDFGCIYDPSECVKIVYVMGVFLFFEEILESILGIQSQVTILLYC